MTATWTECLLGDVITLKRGYDLPHGDRHDGEVPVVSSSGISGYHDESKVKAPGVVTGRYGTLGEVFYLEQDFWPHNTTLYVKDFKGNYPRFISYFLKSIHLAQQNAAGAVPGVNRNHLHMMQVVVPDVATQRKITAILSAYDDLIENNTRRIQLLEEAAQAIYREWFVAFRFPGHEAVEMIKSELGLIPEGWRVDRLDAACSLFKDGDWIETKDQGGSDYRLLQVSNIGVGEFVEKDKYRYITQDTFDRLRCHEVVQGDILVSRMPNPTGRAWLVSPMPFRMITAVDVAIIKADTQVAIPLYLTYLMNSERQLALVEKHTTGTTRPRISRRNLAALPILIPSMAIQEKFSRFASDVYEQKNHLRSRNAVLIEARDLLLPRLISGELDVSELNIELGALAVDAS